MKRPETLRLATRFAAVALVLVGLLEPAEAARDPGLTFPQLTLVSGRKLKQVVVRSYDATSDKFLIVADGKAMVVPLAEFPVSLHPQLKTITPPSGTTVSTIAAPPPSPIHRPSRPAPIVVPRDHSGSAPATAGQAVAVAANAPSAPHRQAAHQHAERYYAFEHQLGSNAGKVTQLDISLNEPKPVPGWEGRYETQGKAYLEYFDSKGRSFRRLTSTFEIITEQKHGEELKVITLTLKS